MPRVPIGVKFERDRASFPFLGYLEENGIAIQGNYRQGGRI
jgi:hypothetical protein